MTIATFTDHFSAEFWTNIAPRVVSFESFKPYLLSDVQKSRILNRGLDGFFQKISAAEPMLKTFHASAARPGSRVLLYNGCGGMGDQILTWPVSKYLADQGFEVHLLCDPHVEFAWQGFPWIRSITLLPCYWEWAGFFDYHAFFETISNSYVHDGQLHPVDMMLSKLGWDPQGIPPSKKIIRPEFSRMEKEFADWQYPGRKLGIFQIRASQDARTLPMENVREILGALATEFPDFQWVGIASNHGRDAKAADPGLPNVEIRRFHRMRLLWALVQRAELAVAPDSMLVHLAGSLGVPCVGLWGIYPPASRIAYYENHRAIFPKEHCPHCPCNWNALGLPSFCPPAKTGTRTSCEVLAAITPELVVQAAKAALGSGMSPETVTLESSGLKAPEKTPPPLEKAS